MLIRFIESLRVIKINETWQLSSCNCRYWHKHFLCKHIIGIAFNLGLCQFPAVELNVEGNRKKGRPSKIKSALMRDRCLEYPTQAIAATQAIEATQADEVTQAVEVTQAIEATQAVEVTQAIEATQAVEVAISHQVTVPLVPRKRGRPPNKPK